MTLPINETNDLFKWQVFFTVFRTVFKTLLNEIKIYEKIICAMLFVFYHAYTQHDVIHHEN